MNVLTTALPAWKTLTDLLGSGDSVVIYGPRYFGKTALLRCAREWYGRQFGALSLLVDSNALQKPDGIDVSALWRRTRRQLKIRPRQRITTAADYEDALGNFLAKGDPQVIFLVDGGGRGRELAHYAAVSLFHKLLAEVSNSGGGHVSLVATDDYSVWYHDVLRLEDSGSPWRYLTKMHCGPLSLEGITGMVTSLRVGTPDVDEFAARIQALTGGHAGLVTELLRDLNTRSWKVRPEYWEGEAREVLNSSHVIEGLRRALEEDPEGLSGTALSFRDPGYPSEETNPRLRFLRQLGILQWKTAHQVMLCPGVLGDLVADMQGAGKGEGSGKAPAIAGPGALKDGNVKVTDDEIVVVHISDLHVGEDYRFRLSWPGGEANKGEHFAQDLLWKDLKSLGLEKRVDAMVITGDFVCEGTSAEFSRAEEVVG
jgi:hypothetical protein